MSSETHTGSETCRGLVKRTQPFHKPWTTKQFSIDVIEELEKKSFTFTLHTNHLLGFIYNNKYLNMS